MVKKSTLLFFLVLLFKGKIFSQIYYPFPSDSAYWNVGYSCSVSFCPPGVLVQPGITYQNGDTILNGIPYHKLYEKVSGYVLNSFYREANKKIYVKYPLGSVFGNDTSEFMLYDFNMMIGDSFKVKVPSTWISTSGPLVKQPVLYLSWTGSININSTNHKTYNFTSNASTSCPITMQWIEGVGSISGFFYNLNYKPWASCLSYPAPYNIYLLCYVRNYYNFPYTPGGCSNLGTRELNISLEAELYPNPFNEIITIENSAEITDPIIEIISLLGQKQNFSIEKQKNSILINTKEIASGVYFLQIRSKEYLYSKKIVKIN